MTVTLRSPSGRATVDLAPEHGGRLAQITVDGHPLLAGDPTDGPLQWGCYPMVPWAGRLDRGELRFAGETHRFPLTMAPHAIHGTTWDQPWEVASASATTARLRVALTAPWPFGGHVDHVVTIGDDGMLMRLDVHATDQAMPVAVGWHPWFRRQLAVGGPAELAFAPERMWVRGADGLPTGELVPPPAGPWDDCFAGVAAPPRLTWPDGLAVTISSDCEQWVVYDEQPQAICVEPQSLPPDGLNHEPPVVEPGRRITRSTVLEWTTHRR